MLLSFACDGLVSVYFAGYGNDYLINHVNALFKQSTFLKEWCDALIPPLVEELAKGLLTLLLIYLLNIKKMQSAFITGVSVGVGFQFIEDIGYLEEQATASLQSFIPETFNRISGAISSHWAYTGIFVLGLFLLLKQNKLKKAVFYLSAPILLHFLWNSPINDYPFVAPMLTTITILLIVTIVQTLNQEQINY